MVKEELEEAIAQYPGGGMVDTWVLEAHIVRCAGSSPVPGTKFLRSKNFVDFPFSIFPEDLASDVICFEAVAFQSEQLCIPQLYPSPLFR